MQRRETGLLVVALAIVALSLLTETRRDVAAASPGARDAARAAPAARPGVDTAALDVDEWLARLKARGMNAEPSGPGLFGGANWQPPPKPPAADQPTKPQTPPFPFTVLGRMKLGDDTMVVLAKGEVTYPAKVGHVIEQFRIDRIDEDGLRVTYLPNGEGRDYRHEELYAAALAAVPSARPALLPVPMPQMAETPVVPVPQQAQATLPPPAKPAEAGTPKAAEGAVPGAASGAAPAGSYNPISNPVAGAGAPIGGMVVTPAPPGNPMIMTPTPAGSTMVTTPSAPGTGMVITPTPSGGGMPITPGAAPGAVPSPTSQ